MKYFKNNLPIPDDLFFTSFMKPKEELMPIEKFDNKWRNIFGGNTAF